MKKFPDFLCIGAQKAGTTWLYQNIKQHPDVWMPPVKEIHYFNRQSPWPLVVQLCRPKDFQMRNFALRGLAKRLKQLKSQPTEQVTGKHTSRSAWPLESKKGNLGWYLRFLLLPRNDKWYASLFSPGLGRVTGDITPYYAHLSQERVTRVYGLMPRAKIIYLLRNPIYRSWSHAVMHFSSNGFSGIETIEMDQILDFLERKSRGRVSDYLGNLKTWSLYPKQQLYVGFFEQLVQNPQGFLKDIYRFLDLDTSDQLVPQTVHKKQNPGQYSAIPERFVRYLARRHYEQIEQLHQRFDNNYTAEWLDFARRHL